MSATRRTTEHWVYHDRGSAASTAGPRRRARDEQARDEQARDEQARDEQARDEGPATNFRAAASHPHELSAATAMCGEPDTTDSATPVSTRAIGSEMSNRRATVAATLADWRRAG